MDMCTAVEPGDRSQDGACRCIAGEAKPNYLHSGGGHLQGSRPASYIYGWLLVLSQTHGVMGEMARQNAGGWHLGT